MKFAVIGTGAVGGLYGGLLARAGHDVHFLLRSDFEHVQRFGLRVDSPLGDFEICPAPAYNNPNDIPRCEFLLICLKTTEQEKLSTVLPDWTDSETTVVTLQNGLGVGDDLAKAAPSSTVISGCCFVASNKTGPGHIEHLDYGRIVVGLNASQPDSDPTLHQRRIDSFVKSFDGIELDVSSIQNIVAARWKKLLWNVPFNGLSVTLDASTDQLLNNSDYRRRVEILMHEVQQISAAEGMPIEDAFLNKLIADTEKMVPYDSSMRLDFLNHRPMEVETIFTRPLRVAERNSIPTPALAELESELKSMNARFS